jgi:hypothetical protein
MRRHADLLLPCLNVPPLEPSATNGSDRGFAINALLISGTYERYSDVPTDQEFIRLMTSVQERALDLPATG